MKKSDLLTIRISPQMKYGLDLICRFEGKTMTQVVSSAIEEKARAHGLLNTLEPGRPTRLLDALWSPLDSERVLRITEFLGEDKLTPEERARLEAVYELCGWLNDKHNPGEERFHPQMMRGEKLEAIWQVVPLRRFKVMAQDDLVQTAESLLGL